MPQVARAKVAAPVLIALLFAAAPLLAQAPPPSEPVPPDNEAQSGQAPAPSTREEQIVAERQRKRATLWPERENRFVATANRLVDRGFVEGIESGEGNNGWQLLLSGTRPNQGQTVGLGYRRSDLFQDALTLRGTARGTLHGAALVDGELNVNRLRRSADTFINMYAKYERSPRMEFYGIGANSSEADRTGYLLETGVFELHSGYRFTRQLNAGFTFGYGKAHTGPVTRDGVPSIETKFDATTAPGLFDDTDFLFWGAFAGLDTRDHPRGPRRGGFYGINFSRFLDKTGGQYSHRQLELSGQQFFPYFNATKVIALFVKARFAFTDRVDQVVPFYMLPTLGGSYDLRGYGHYRFQDNNFIIATLEHRWYVFSGVEMALFGESGTTVPTKGHITADDLNHSGGLGVRVRVGGAIVIRTDVATGREGWRVIWSLSDVSRRRF